MKGHLERLAVVFNAEAEPLSAVDVRVCRTGVVNYGDGPEETSKTESMSLPVSELSDKTLGLLRTLNNALVADIAAMAQRRAEAVSEAAEVQVAAAQRKAEETQKAADEAVRESERLAARDKS